MASKRKHCISILEMECSESEICMDDMVKRNLHDALISGLFGKFHLLQKRKETPVYETVSPLHNCVH